MKYARNTFLALVVLVLVYGGCYRLFFRSEMLAFFRTQGLSPFDFSMEDGAWRRFYAPASEIDLRLTYDRPEKKRLRGHWLSEKPGDYLILAKDGSCRFQLGEFAFSGNLKFFRQLPHYEGQFQHRGRPHHFYFYIGIESDGRANVNIARPDENFPDEFPNLTRAPAPD